MSDRSRRRVLRTTSPRDREANWDLWIWDGIPRFGERWRYLALLGVSPSQVSNGNNEFRPDPGSARTLSLVDTPSHQTVIVLQALATDRLGQFNNGPLSRKLGILAHR